jgi:hypothetical protein
MERAFVTRRCNKAHNFRTKPLSVKATYKVAFHLVGAKPNGTRVCNSPVQQSAQFQNKAPIRKSDLQSRVPFGGGETKWNASLQLAFNLGRLEVDHGVASTHARENEPRTKASLLLPDTAQLSLGLPQHSELPFRPA